MKKLILLVIILILFAIMVLLSCSENSWEGNIKSNTLEKNNKGEIIGVTLTLKEFPDYKFFVPKEIASGDILLEMGGDSLSEQIIQNQFGCQTALPKGYGLTKEGIIKIFGFKKNINLIEATKIITDMSKYRWMLKDHFKLEDLGKGEKNG